jgi:hypothetical protein
MEQLCGRPHMLVVAKDTCPSPARIVLMSTPQRSRWVCTGTEAGENTTAR